MKKSNKNLGSVIVKLFSVLFIFLLLPVMVYAVPITIDLNSGAAISFQNEGTLEAYQTTLLQNLDNSWAPIKTGTVINDYYATGTSQNYFDAVSLNFDLSSIGWNNIENATLRFYVQKGDYIREWWHHYEVLEGEKNPLHGDIAPTGWDGLINFGDYESNEVVGWLESDIPVSWITANASNDFYITLRLWNVRIDKVELSVNPVPEPSTCLLFLFGIIGMSGVKKKISQ